MFLSISPELFTTHRKILLEFSDKSHNVSTISNSDDIVDSTDKLGFMRFPSEYCVWKPDQTGFFLCASNIYSLYTIEWIIYLIYHFFEKWKYTISGCFKISDKYILVKRNVVTVYSVKTGLIEKKWSLEIAISFIQDVFLDTISKSIPETEWKVEKCNYTKSFINRSLRTVFLSKKEIFENCRKNGLKNCVNLVKTRLEKSNNHRMNLRNSNFLLFTH